MPKRGHCCIFSVGEVGLVSIEVLCVNCNPLCWMRIIWDCMEQRFNRTFSCVELSVIELKSSYLDSYLSDPTLLVQMKRILLLFILTSSFSDPNSLGESTV